VSSRSYLSIGDVLTLLRQEFPDVTISKIRFLESQGLVNPERTPSGYRKFYEHDVERLRWVLRQQREHFLPLKVIKDRLEDEDGGGTPVSGAAVTPSAPVPVAEPVEAPVLVGADARAADGGTAVAPTTALPGIETAARHRTPARATATVATTTSGSAGAATTATDLTDPPAHRAHRATLAAPTVSPTGPTTAPAVGSVPVTNGATNGVAASGSGGHAGTESDDRPASKPAKGTTRRTAGAPVRSRGAASGAASSDAAGDRGEPPVDPPVTDTGVGVGGASLSLDELCAASGLSPEGVSELQDYGLLSANVAAGVEFFDEEALAVAHLAAGFASFGVEARHLRLYKNAADREAGFIEQIVIPLVRQRNPEARARATRTAEELSRLGQQLKASLLRTALRDIL